MLSFVASVLSLKNRAWSNKIATWRKESMGQLFLLLRFLLHWLLTLLNARVTLFLKIGSSNILSITLLSFSVLNICLHVKHLMITTTSSALPIHYSSCADDYCFKMSTFPSIRSYLILEAFIGCWRYLY